VSSCILSQMGYKCGMRRVAWLVGLVGCSTDEPDRAPPPPVTIAVPAPVTTGPTTLPSPPPQPGMTVRLLSPGAEPRRELRYRPRPGTETKVALRMATDMAMSAGGHRMFGQKNKSTGTLALRVDRVEAGGNVVVGLRVVDMDEPNYDPSRASRKSLTGLTGSFTISDRGQLLSASASLESQETKAVMYLIDYLNALPVEPVGVGAVWELDNTLLRNGITMRVVQTHRLVALDAAGARTEMTEQQSAPPQRATNFIDDALTAFEVNTFTGSGSGKTQIAFDRPLPVDTTSEFEFTTAMTISRPTFTQKVDMTMQAEIHTKLD
jgi:hypothetical protein